LHHYLHNVSLVGEHLRYAFIHKGRWLAVATWSAAAFHIKDRDQFIGWSGEQCHRRRALLANNSRLLVMPECHYPNLISRFMKLMLERLSTDWQKHWGHPLALVETFVDPRYYTGTAYKVSGWSHLGQKRGVETQCRRFLRKEQCAQTDLGSRTGQEGLREVARARNCLWIGLKSNKPLQSVASPKSPRSAV
jgi:hypothetical protein